MLVGSNGFLRSGQVETIQNTIYMDRVNKKETKTMRLYNVYNKITCAFYIVIGKGRVLESTEGR